MALPRLGPFPPRFIRTVVTVFCLWFFSQSAWSQSIDGKSRTWTDASGDYRTIAKMIEYEGGNVHLQRVDGKVVIVPLKRLSRADQRWIRQALASLRAAKNRKPDSEPASAPTAPTWPGWRGPNRDGKSPDTGLLKEWPPEGPKLLWSINDIGKGYSSVAVANNSVYVTGDKDGRLMLFSMDLNGTPQWQVPIDKAWTESYPGSRATPTIDENRLYLVSGNGVIGCWDANNGQPKWQHHMREFGGSVPGWGYSESVLIYKNLAIVTPGGNNCIVALDKINGRPEWASQGVRAGAQYSSCNACTHAGVPMIINGTAEGLVSVDPDNGRAQWSNPFSAHNTANCPTPAYADGYIFWANGYGKGGICLKLTAARGRLTAEQAWTTDEMVCHHGGYIIHEGHIYGNHNNGWTCLELQTGKPCWREHGVGKGSLCFADGMLYLFGEHGGKVGLATCSPDGFEMKGSFSVEGEGTSWAHPVVIGGHLYIRYDTNLYCYDVRE